MILIFDLGLGQRGAIVNAPIYRLQPFIYVAAIQKIDECTRDHRFVLRAHGQIRILPLAQDAQADEIGTLKINILFGVLAAFGTDLRGGHLRFARAQFVIDLDFDRQAMTIPPGNVR